MTFFLGIYIYIYINGFQIPYLKEKKTKHRFSPGFARVMGRPAGSLGFGRAVAPAGFLLNPDRSSHWVDPQGRARFNNNEKYHNETHVKWNLWTL
jgi:hypothetical protein